MRHAPYFPSACATEAADKKATQRRAALHVVRGQLKVAADLLSKDSELKEVKPPVGVTQPSVDSLRQRLLRETGGWR